MKKFNFEARQKLLLKSFYSSYIKGTTIFHQGDFGDFMYIILKGSVGVRIKNLALGTEPLIVATLREGEQFGELALIKTYDPRSKNSGINRPRRRASCVCMEDCHLLGFPANIVNEVIVDLLSTKLKPDIEFIQTIEYFSDLCDSDIFPLINNMKKLKFGYGEYIIREGEIPRGMYIIRSGLCMLCIESIGTREGTNITADSLFEDKLSTKKTVDKMMMPKGFSNNILYKETSKSFLKDKIIYHNLVYVILNIDSN